MASKTEKKTAENWDAIIQRVEACTYVTTAQARLDLEEEIEIGAAFNYDPYGEDWNANIERIEKAVADRADFIDINAEVTPAGVVVGPSVDDLIGCE